MKIICFHVLNDFSGSPKVLEMVLSGFLSKGYSIDLITSKGNGALSNLALQPNVRMVGYHYVFTRSMLWNAIQYIFVQLYIFFYVFRYAFRDDVVFYINTIMPVAAAISAKLLRKKVIYHYHENAATKSKFYILLAWFMQRLADKIICVSDYQRSFLKRKDNVVTIANSLPPSFEGACVNFRSFPKTDKRVLMLSSLKLYKGTLEFCQLASALQGYQFELVINDTWDNIKEFIAQYHLSLPLNLKIWDRQMNVLPFYKRASLVLNLTNKRMVVETFGMTVLEALTSGIPVIVPTVGGVSDLVVDGYNGYKIDVDELDKIQTTITTIFEDVSLYKYLSMNAILTSQKYSYRLTIDSIEKEIFN